MTHRMCSSDHLPLRDVRPEDGMSTAEYAVGTLGACTFALVLHAIAADGSFFDLIAGFFRLLDGFPVPNLRLR